MSIAVEFFNWSTSGLPFDEAPWETCSPNLLAVNAFVDSWWGGYSLGCEGDRDIRGGSLPSAHSYGGAYDRRFRRGRDGKTGAVWPSWAGPQLTRVQAVEILRWWIDNSFELHIDAIHDYDGARIWRAGRTSNVAEAHTKWWKTNTTAEGMGEAWATYFHVETHHSGWHDDRPVRLRPGIVLPNGGPPDPPPPDPDPPDPPDPDPPDPPAIDTGGDDMFSIAGKTLNSDGTIGAFRIGNGRTSIVVGTGLTAQHEAVNARFGGMVDAKTGALSTRWGGINALPPADLDRICGQVR